MWWGICNVMGLFFSPKTPENLISIIRKFRHQEHQEILNENLAASAKKVLVGPSSSITIQSICLNPHMYLYNLPQNRHLSGETGKRKVMTRLMDSNFLRRIF